MNIRVDLHIHDDSTHADEKFDRILKRLEDLMSLSSEALAAIQAEGTQIDSFITLFQQIKDQLAAALANTTIPAAVQADIDKIFELSTAQAAKIVGVTTTTPAGTPAPVGA